MEIAAVTYQWVYCTTAMKNRSKKLTGAELGFQRLGYLQASTSPMLGSLGGHDKLDEGEGFFG